MICILSACIIVGTTGVEERKAGHPRTAKASGNHRHRGLRQQAWHIRGARDLGSYSLRNGDSKISGTKSPITAANVPSQPGSVPPPFPPPSMELTKIWIERNRCQFGPRSTANIHKHLAGENPTPVDLEWHEGAPDCKQSPDFGIDGGHRPCESPRPPSARVLVSRDWQDLGVHSLQQIRDALQDGTLLANDWVWREGAEHWIKLAELPT